MSTMGRRFGDGRDGMAAASGLAAASWAAARSVSAIGPASALICARGTDLIHGPMDLQEAVTSDDPSCIFSLQRITVRSGYYRVTQPGQRAP